MYQAQFGPKITNGIKTLIIINVAVFAIQQLISMLLFGFNSLGTRTPSTPFDILFSVSAVDSENFQVWQVFTYMFLHGGFFHIGINMFMLWMFGSELENLMGKKEFYKYYLVCGLGAGVIIAVGNMYLIPTGTPSLTLGASGAVLSVLFAYAVFWPDRQLLFMMMIPVKTKFVVLFYAAISIYSMMGSGGDGISHIGHLGGFVAGLIYLGLYKKIPVIERLFGKATDDKFKKVYRNVKTKTSKPFYKFDMNHPGVDKKVNELLDKISKDGIHSLTETERQFLQAVSKHKSKKDADN
ncbi:MAG: rhomboid family intramembrane serine protease [Leptospirales bacterium]